VTPALRTATAMMAALWLACADPFLPPGPAGPLPRGLVLVLVVDQMRADELEPGLPGGLGWLARTGRVHDQARLEHAHTETCPGHAVLLTGHHPGRAGIPGNVFVDRLTGESHYCVEDDDPGSAVLAGDGGLSPRWLRVTGLGDWLKAADPRARVHAVSAKDRAAIILGGQHPDGAWWLDRAEGTGFTTSGWYRRSLPRWVAAWNRGDLFDEAPEQWRHPSGHEGPSPRIDAYPVESPRFERASPHPVLREDDRKGSLERLYWSPFGDELVLRFALELVEREDLGQGETLDLLAVSLSSLDAVGHLYGPESHEALDALRRLDAWLEDFLDEVEDEVDDDRLWIALTSDHGVLPLPEWLHETGRSECPVPGGRGDSRALEAGVEAVLDRAFGPSEASWFHRSGYRYTVNRSVAAERGVTVDEVVRVARGHLEAQRGIRRVWSAAEIQEGAGSEPFVSLYRHSFDPERSGDLELQPEPTCLFTSYATGTNHGSPYLYDRAVPLVLQGPGVVPGRVTEPVATVDLAPTLAAHLGIPAPEGLAGRVLPLGTPTGR